MPDSTPRVQPFAVGWEHTAWSGGFYPDDLPDEWRLTYYANEFPGVLVPTERWQYVGDEVLQEWVDDVHESFGFFLELAQTAPTVEEQRRAALLGDHFVAWVVPQGSQADDGVTPCYLDGLTGSRLAFQVDAERLGDLKAARHLLERLADQASGNRELPIFLRGSGWQVERLRQLSQLSQLLGLA